MSWLLQAEQTWCVCALPRKLLGTYLEGVITISECDQYGAVIHCGGAKESQIPRCYLRAFGICSGRHGASVGQSRACVRAEPSSFDCDIGLSRTERESQYIMSLRDGRN